RSSTRTAWRFASSGRTSPPTYPDPPTTSTRIHRQDSRMSRVPLLLAVAQPECVSFDVAANALAHAALVRRAGARVVVFPELSLTGYELDAPPLAADDARLAPLVEACAETGSVALAGAPVPGPHIGT